MTKSLRKSSQVRPRWSMLRWVGVGLLVSLSVTARAEGDEGEAASAVAAVGVIDPHAEALSAVIMGVVDKAKLAPTPPATPRVIRPLRPEEPMSAWRFELQVPLVKQVGHKTNCGPSAAAMAILAFDVSKAVAQQVREMRDVIGEWTWQAFPMRQMRLPGYDAGMSTRHMMKVSMERFAPDVAWAPVAHPWLPLEAWSLVTLKKALAERRPLVVLAEARTLWGLDAAGLHWVVVTGIDNGQVVFNDSADGMTAKIALDRFWTAWRLPAIYRSLPMVAGFEALVADRSLPVDHVPAPDLRPAWIPPR